jgi:hypothetical protein
MVNGRAFFSYEFSPDLKLLRAEREEEEYSKDEKLRRYFPNSRGEFFQQEGFEVRQNFAIGAKQTIQFVKYTDTWRWNWFWRDYMVERFIRQSVDMEKIDGEKYYLVHQFYHAGLNKVFAWIAFKEKGKLLLQSQATGRPMLEKYQLISVDENLQMEVVDSVNFPFKMELARAWMLNFNDDEHYLGQYRTHEIPDPMARMVYLFAPSGGLYTGNKDKDEGNWRMLLMDWKGKAKWVDLDLPAGGWKITDVLHRNDTILIWGPAKAGRYFNSLPGDYTNEITKNAAKYKTFQIARIIGDKVDTVVAYPFKAFRSMADKQAKRLRHAYRGKQFHFSYSKMGPNGELFIGGQKIEEDQVKVENPNGGESTQTRTIRTGYRQPILMCFNGALKLQKVYGYRLYHKLSQRDDAVNPMWVHYNDKGEIFWEVSELWDLRQYGYSEPMFTNNAFLTYFGPTIFTSMNKYLFFPRLHKINPAKGTILAPVNVGLNDKGRQRFYSDNFVPFKRLSDGSVLYIGYDGTYSRLWIARVALD